MRFHHFKMHREPGANNYYINEDEVIPTLGGEGSPDFNKWYTFVTRYIEALHWYNNHTSPINGDTAYANLNGWIAGFMAASHIEEIENLSEGTIMLERNGKPFLKFDRIPLSEAERASRRENNKVWRALIGD